MTPSPEPAQQHDVAHVRSRDADLRLALTCPACGAAGWLKWSSLRRMIGCPQCHHQFLISSSGTLRSRQDLPQRYYKCPRCGESDTIPVLPGVRGVACGACRLPLAPGPDRRLHGVKEAAQLQRAAHAAKRLHNQRDRHHAHSPVLQIRRRTVYLSGAVLVASLVGALFALTSRLGAPPEIRACRQFTNACLNGNSQRARELVGEDPVQQAEFDRWRMRYFTSIIAKHRPPGDNAQIEVDVVHQSNRVRTMRVTMKSPFIGQRIHTQHWTEQAGTWHFDAVATLSDGDPTPSRYERAAP